MNFRHIKFPLIGLVALLFGGCSNDIQVNAPKKDIIVVYGVLNPQANEQVIRVSRAFQTESDAVKYASENDLSLKNANVTLTYRNLQGQTITIRLNPRDSIRQAGSFTQKITVYTTRDAIYPGFRYDLRVEVPASDNSTPMVATAYTYVPERPTMLRPDNERLTGNPDSPDLQGTTRGYPLAFFNDENYSIRFTRGATLGSKKVYGRGYEYRVYFKYKEVDSDQPITTMYGPSSLFSESNVACPGNVGPDVVCYRIGKDFQNFMRSTLNPAKTFTYDDGNLSKDTYIEVTAVDTFLYNYMRVNSPAFTDFTTVKPEYTNINGGLGVLGAINTNQSYVRLTPCTRYLLRLNNQQKPDVFCE